MVAEKNGTIRFYDLLAQQAILSLESEQMPLMSAHWCLKNTFRVGAVAGNDWLIWDITRSRYFLSIFICCLPKNQSLLLNDPLTILVYLGLSMDRANSNLSKAMGFYITERGTHALQVYFESNQKEQGRGGIFDLRVFTYV